MALNQIAPEQDRTRRIADVLPLSVGLRERALPAAEHLRLVLELEYMT